MNERPERRANDARIDRIEGRLDEIEKMVSDVHAIIGHGRSFFTVLGAIGNAVKWLAAVTAAVVALWVTWTAKNGGGS